MLVMFCPDCSTDLDSTPVNDPCPGCGGRRRSAGAEAGCARGSVTVHDARAVGHSHLPGGAERIDVGSRTFRSSSLGGSGADRQLFEGRPGTNEDDVAEVCAILRQALDNDGEQWGQFEPQDRRIDDTDAAAVDRAGRRLSVQVVRAEQAAWSELARAGVADRSVAASELAGAVLEAIERKTRKYPMAQRQGLLLALDSIRAPGHVQRPVVDLLRSDHADSIARAGFAAVWLVGPTAQLTYRLA